MNRSRTIVVALLAAVTGLSASDAVAGDGPTYRINLDRQFETGQRFRVRGDGLLQQSLTPLQGGGNDQSQETGFKISFDAEATITAVNGNGHPTRATYAVAECVLMQNSKATQIATPGSTITATLRDGKTWFEIDGRKVDQAAATALRLVADLNRLQSKDSAVVGTNQSRSVGESWPIDARHAARVMGPAFGKADSLTGSTTFVEVIEHEGYPCMSLYTSVTANGKAQGVSNIPRGFTLGEAMTSTTSHRLFPIDEQMPLVSDFSTFEIEAVLVESGKRSSPRTMQLKLRQFVQLEKTPLGAMSGVTESNSGQ